MVEAPLSGARPEDELLLCCASTYADAERAGRIGALLRHDIDWQVLLWKGYRHGVQSLLYRHLNLTCPEAVPEAILSQLRFLYQATLAGNLISSGRLLKILHLLEEQGIPAVPFKGPVLAAFVYGDLALREGGTPSVLVHKQDVSRIRDLLVSEGYQASQLPGKLVFRHARRTVVNLRWDLSAAYSSFLVDPEGLWERLVPLSWLGGQNILTLSPEDWLLFLCVEGAKQVWRGLLPVCDVARVVGAPRGTDWGWAMKQACELGSERMLFLGLLLARDLLGAALPDEVLHQALADPDLESLVAQVRESALSAGSPTTLERVLFHLRVRERWRDRVQQGLALLPGLGREYVVDPFARRLHLRSDRVPFLPASPERVERMLALAQVRPGDVVYDLGCGDGRIVIMAAKRHGARGVGVDLDPRRIAESEANARQEGVEHLVTFLQHDATKVDLSPATVVTLYMGSSWNLKIRAKLRRQLRPGSRIVSSSFDMGDWPPLETEFVTDGDGLIHALYLWRVETVGASARASGAPRGTARQ